MTPKPAKRFKPIDERIEALSETLPDSEHKLAQLLTAQPALLATHSATELAAIAGSSKAAVTRFIQRVGYDGFASARREAREAQRWGAPGLQAASDLSAASEEAFGEHLRRDLQNLARTFEKLTSGVVEPAIATLARARRVGVIGYRNSHALAQYFARQLILLKDHVALLPQAGQTIGEDLAAFGPDDMLVILAFRRRVPVVAEIARHDGPVHRADDLAQTDLLGRTGQEVPTGHAAFGTNEAGALECQQDLLQVGLGKSGAFGDVAHRRGRLVPAQRERQQGPTGVVAAC